MLLLVSVPEKPGRNIPVPSRGCSRRARPVGAPGRGAAVNISVLTAPGWKTPTWGGGGGIGSAPGATAPPGPLSAFPHRGILSRRGVTGHRLRLGEKDPAPAGGCAAPRRERERGEGHYAAGRGEARSGGRGGETEAAARPWSGDGAGDRPRAGGLHPWERDRPWGCASPCSYLGDQMPGREETGGFVLFYF